MSVGVGIVLTGLLLAACSGNPLVSSPTIEGRLPDGRGFRASFSPGFVGEEPESVSAAIVINLDHVKPSFDGQECAIPCAPVLGITTFHPGSGQEPRYANGTYEATSGDWTMKVAVYQHIIDAWGDDIGALLLESIAPIDADGGLPAFELSGLLRWATDDEIPLQMGVSYPSLVVRRGCEPSNVACSPSGSVQVIPSEVVYGSSPEWDHNRKVLISDVP